MYTLKNLTLFALFVFLFLAALKGASLTVVKTIGNEDEKNYLFFRISGAVLSENKDIYVLDSTGNFIAKYDWKGKFIKKIGKTGSGPPPDFSGPKNLDIIGNKLYFMDILNARIVELNTDLEDLKYHKIYNGLSSTHNFFAVAEDQYIGENMTYDVTDSHQIRIFSLKKPGVLTFFDYTPFRKKKTLNPHSREYMKSTFFSKPKFGIHRERNMILISFLFPDNPIEFFLYSLDGKCLGEFSHEIEKKYSFPYHYLESRTKFPSVAYTPIINGVFIHNNCYIVFLIKKKQNKKVVEELKTECLIFEKNGGCLKAKFEVAPDLTPFFLSKEGFLLGKRYREEEVKLYIYRLEI